jgi:membrane dipeptidase
MLIVDAHLDLAWNALQWNRDLRQSALTIRTQELGTPGAGRGRGTVALPELRQGRVAVCFATTLARSTGRPEPHIDYLSPAQAYATAQGQLAYYRALERDGHIRILRRSADLDSHVAEWEAWEQSDLPGPGATSPPPLGVVLSMESADPVLRPEDLPDWWDAGVRIVGPAHYGPGRYAGGTGTELGLTSEGVALLERMARQGVALDVTHLSDLAFQQALERYEGPVLASHNNCRAIVSHQRQFSDDQLRAIIARNGVIGAALDTWMLQLGWTIGTSSNAGLTLSTVVDHIDHVCQVAGSSRHAAIGSDLDGGFGSEESPSDLNTIADLQKVGPMLAERGYGPEDIAGIMHGNWLRLLHGTL